MPKLSNFNLLNQVIDKTNSLVPFSANKGRSHVIKSVLIHAVRNKVPRHIKNQISALNLDPGYTPRSSSKKP